MMASYIESLITGFWSTLRGNAFNSPNYTDLFHISKCIVLSHKLKGGADGEKIKEYEDSLRYIGENINPKFRLNLTVVQLMIFKNWVKGPSAEIEIEGSSYKLYELYKALEDDVITELCRIVTEIGQNYSLDISYGSDIFGESKAVLKA